MALAALLVQPHPKPAVLDVNILHLHGERRADAGVGIDHQPDERAVAETNRRRHVNAVEERPRLGGIEHGRLADFDDMLRSAHAGGGVGRHNLPGHQTIEQHANGSEALLRGRRAVFAGERFDISADMQGLHVGERGGALPLAPGEELPDRAAIGAARMRVADVRDEEFPKARPRALARGGEKPGSGGDVMGRS